MAFDSRSGGRTSHSAPPAMLPNAPRPSAAEWSALREEGIQWEGQVLLAGMGMDLPVLLVLTSTRLVMVANGAIALEAPRTWLRPEPKLLTGGTVGLSITPHDRASRPGETDKMAVKVRSGRADAARLVSAITGRIVSPREERSIALEQEPGAWKPAVGAAPPVALPPLPDFDDDPVLARANRAWPPVELEGVPQPRKTRPARPADAQATLSNWIANHNEAGDETASPATHRRRAASAPVTGPAETRRQFHRGLVWGLRSLILALLVGTGVYFGHDRLPGDFTFRLPAALEDRFGLDDESDQPDVSQMPSGQTGSEGPAVQPTATTPTEDGTSGAPNGEPISTEDLPEGVGGNQGEITTVDPGIGTYADDDEATDPTAESTQAPETSIDDPADEGTTGDTSGTDSNEVTVGNGDPNAPAATEAPVATEAPATEAPVETEVVATEAPGTEAPVTEEPVETEIPATEAPVETEAPATEAPVTEEPAATEAPVEQESTPTVPAEVPTEQQSTPQPTLEPQPSTVNPDIPPAQELTSGPFRYAITGASQGETIPALPDLASVDTGEWVILSLTGQNTAGTEQVFDMSQFRLYADGQEVLLDVGNGWVSGLLGQTPAYGNTDAILWAGGESHDFTLTFLVPKGAQSLTLVAGDQTIDLSTSLATTELGAATTTQPAPEGIEATVVGVVDAETIVVEIDGVRQTVRYLGVDVPSGDDCFAEEAIAANESLVMGQKVRIERQATDTDARGNWVRDVWVPSADGGWTLVSEALVREGAAEANISKPNTRFEAWLQSSQFMARDEGVGLWGACESDGAALANPPLSIRPNLSVQS